ncbi:phenylalanine--tRNA ligase subunit beta [Candidatus Altiarchaeota archaeon]
MPTVEFDTRDFAELVGGDYSLNELEEWIPMIGVGLEHIDEKTIELEVFPNRPDMLSIEGFARAFKGFLGRETSLSSYPVEDSGIVLQVSDSVAGVRPYCAAAVCRGVRFTENSLKSLMDIQEKLHTTHGRNRMKVAIGVHDLDTLCPPFTYKAVEPDSVSFVPLDMGQELSLRQILSEHPKGRDYAWTLEGKSRWPLFVDSQDVVLSFPPIINGQHSRLTRDTSNLFIEMTGTSQIALDQALNIILSSLNDRGGDILSVEKRRLK